MFAWRAATGFGKGVVVNLDSLSFRDDAERFREAAESVRPGSMLNEY